MECGLEFDAYSWPRLWRGAAASDRRSVECGVERASASLCWLAERLVRGVRDED